ncbi:hypothetical protein T01_13834 [Trichinella spiralis]|uniref:Uncharacterized protein n=1 Tax=Trichinella spiralis TaxID=6334 RepID=A0A0V0YTI2_TRISP|nr:hypothetical protein T01_13834 [Trichinella spiralis]
MTSSYLRHHLLGVLPKSANEDPTVRLFRSGNYAPW